MKIKITEINLDHFTVKEKLNMASNLILEAVLDFSIPINIDQGKELDKIRDDLKKVISDL